MGFRALLEAHERKSVTKLVFPLEEKKQILQKERQEDEKNNPKENTVE